MWAACGRKTSSGRPNVGLRGRLVLRPRGWRLGEERRDVAAEADDAVIGLDTILAAGVSPALILSSVIRARLAATALGSIARRRLRLGLRSWLPLAFGRAG